jgi:hypothetical protein
MPTLSNSGTVEVIVDSVLEVQHISELSVGPPGPPGPAGTQGPSVGVVSVAFTSSNPWVINHNLGRPTQVTVYTVGGVQMLCNIVNVSNNQAQAHFDGPVSGYALYS